MAFLRTTFGGSAVVVRRRARRDLILLTAWIALLAFVVFLSIEGPHLLIDTVDNGARQAVASAGERADIVLHTAVGFGGPSDQRPVLAPDRVVPAVTSVRQALPADIARVYRDTVVSVVGPQTHIATVDGTAEASDVSVSVAMMTPANRARLEVSSGRLPASTESADSTLTEIAISSAAARATGLKVGDTVAVAPSDGTISLDPAKNIQLRVVGIVGERQADAAQWEDVPALWTPVRTKGTTTIAVLASPAGIAAIAPVYSAHFTGMLRLRLDSTKFTAARERSVGAAITRLAVNSTALSQSVSTNFSVTSDYGSALAAFPSESRAALAQMSVTLAGLLGVAAAVLITLSRLLVLRRRGEVLLERARGSSLASIAARSLAESLGATLIGGILGTAVALAVRPGVPQDAEALVAVLIVGLLAAPVQTVLLTRGAWGGRKVPANAQDRAEIAGRARGIRRAVEITIIVLGVAALFALTGRGLLETSTSGIDPFLASAPLLFAIVTTIVGLRIYPWPVRFIGSFARRSRGVIGLVGAARASGAVAVLPLLALTLATAMIVSGGLLVATVNAGQEVASWQRIGADARVDAPITAAQAARVAAAPGVTASTAARLDVAIQTKLGSSVDFPTVISVDSNFEQLVRHLPAGTLGASSPRVFAKLHTKTAGAIPVIVDQELANEIVTKNIGMYYGDGLIDLRVVGVTDLIPSGYLGGPFMYLDRSALDAQLPKPVGANLLLATGPGANAAVSALGLPASDVHLRTSWLTARRGLALVSGTQQTMLFVTIALALLAMIGLIATVLAGARDRGRSLSLLRTLGLRPGLGWWLALAELAPIVIAALIGGVIAGTGMVLILEPSLGLQVLSDGVNPPQTVVPPSLIIGLIAGTIVLLGVSILVEVVAHRRDKLSEVLRVGETV